MPSAGFLSNIHRFTGVDASGQRVAPAGYGKALKDDYRRFYGARVSFAGRGEMIPNARSYCELDPAVVDRWGIPVLRFHWEWSDHELNQVKHMQQTFRSLIAEMGGEVFSPAGVGGPRARHCPPSAKQLGVEGGQGLAGGGLEQRDRARDAGAQPPAELVVKLIAQYSQRVLVAARARGGELDGEGQPVELLHDLVHGRQRLGVDRTRPLHEQLHRLGGGQRAQRQ